MQILINLFFISSRDIAINRLPTICPDIREWITERKGVCTFIFIEEPPHRWESEVKRQMQMLIADFADTHVIHDMILPSDVFREMKRRNAQHKETPIEQPR